MVLHGRFKFQFQIKQGIKEQVAEIYWQQLFRLDLNHYLMAEGWKILGLSKEYV
jgi:hypothetical protein